ncbi:hypothetical protein BV20DRAFT_153989 [Pilatotrama ljubarskyi]|nr:hypothetical protein BV20DRAFT_153989 [Pilatotrama ljubarskyi]
MYTPPTCGGDSAPTARARQSNDVGHADLAKRPRPPCSTLHRRGPCSLFAACALRSHGASLDRPGVVVEFNVAVHGDSGRSVIVRTDRGRYAGARCARPSSGADAPGIGPSDRYSQWDSLGERKTNQQGGRWARVPHRCPPPWRSSRLYFLPDKCTGYILELTQDLGH